MGRTGCPAIRAGRLTPMKKSFQGRLTARGPGGAWTFLEIPFRVEEVFGSKSRVAVSGTMNGFAFRNSLLSQGDGTHAMAVSKQLQAGAGAKAGDTVAVVLEVDKGERVVEIPMELKKALAASKVAAKAFEALSVSHRKEFAEWIGGAKKPETRLARAEKALPMILAREHCR